MKSKIKSSLLVLALVLGCGPVQARYQLLTPAEMVRNADVIAVVDIGNVVNQETIGKQDTLSRRLIYREKATARVEQLIKGTTGNSIELVGRITNARCLPDWNIKAGRHLIFVCKVSDTAYSTANAGVGLLGINNSKVSWFANMNTLGKCFETPLSKAVADIKSILNKKEQRDETTGVRPVFVRPKQGLR